MAYLVFADGTAFRGERFHGEAHGECVVYTGKDNHHEVLCNPALYKKIVIYMYPHAGIRSKTDDGQRTMAAGAIGRDISNDPDGHMSLADYMSGNEIGGISGMDTRPLIRYIKSRGMQTAAIADSTERCAHILRFPPEIEREYTTESTWEPVNKVALLDLGLTTKHIDYFRRKVDLDIFNPDISMDELKNYRAFIIAGGCEDYIPAVEKTVSSVIALGRPTIGYGLGHMLMAKEHGWAIERNRCFFGPSQPVKRRENERVIYAERADWYSVGGRGDGKPIYADIDKSEDFSGLRYNKQSLSLAFEPESYREANDFFSQIGGGDNA